MTIDGQKLANTLLAAVLLALMLGGASAYQESIRRGVLMENLTEAVQELKVEVVKLRDAAHTHGPATRMYLPDAEVED